jgi:hypothetical protein
MSRLKKIADARDLQQYNACLQSLQMSQEWLEDVSLQNWLTNKWIPAHQVIFNFWPNERSHQYMVS